MQDKIRSLLQISSELAREVDLRRMLLHLADITRGLLEADRCSIFLHDPDRGQLWTVIAHGVPEIRLPEGDGVVGDVFRQGRRLNIPDAYGDSRFDPAVDGRTGYRTRTLLAEPMWHGDGTPLGVFEVINRVAPGPFSSEDEDLLGHVAAYAAAAIDNALLRERLHRAHEDAIYCLSTATKHKDRETENHIVRVGLGAEMLGAALGWDAGKRETARLAAPMHDVGKVVIPDTILLKPGALTDEEWAIMRRHCFYGHDILSGRGSPLLQVAATIALQHHERWDGQGYPAGLKGRQISEWGRVTAIVDAFDALTSTRPYKDSWDPREALREMGRSAGTRFDPDLLAVFLAHADEAVAIREAYRDE